MKLSRLHALALLAPLSLCTTALAQEPAPAVAPVELSETMDMAAVIALLKQQQEELNAQRERLDAQASKITSLTQELDALRAAPGTEPIPQTTPAPAQTIASTPPAEQADGGRGTPELQEGAEDGTRGEQIDIAKTVQSKSESDKKSSKAIADAQTDDPTEELLDQFPGAWRLPGTNSAFRVGGYVRAAVVLNADVLDIPDRFIVGSIPIDQGDSDENAAQSSITANQSRLNFDFREPTEAGILRAFIEGDFTGNGDSFRLRHAFGQWNRILAGQTWSAFVDTSASPEGVDFEGLNGRVNVRQSQIRYSPEIGESFQFQLSLEDPNPQIQNGNGVTRVPDLVLAGRFQPHERLHVRAAFLGRQIRGQESLPDGSTANAGVDKEYAWGVSFSGSFAMPRFDKRDKFLFQLSKGDSIGRYVNDLSSTGNYDGIFNQNSRKLELFDVLAGYGSLQHWWMDDRSLRSNLTLGYVEIDNPSFVAGDAYKRTIRASANLLWNPTPHVDTGIEYLWGKRENKDGDSGEAKQLQMMIRYIF